MVSDGISGKPVVGVKIVATTQTDIVEEKSNSEIITETDDHGRFLIASKLALRTFNVKFSKDKYSEVFTQWDVPEFEQTRDIGTVNIFRFPDVEGLVIDAVSGSPLAGCKVELSSIEIQTDTEGKFRFAQISPGDQTVKATCGDKVRTTSVFVDSRADVENIGPLEVSNITPSPTDFWYFDGATVHPIESEHKLSRWFQEVYITSKHCPATRVDNRRGDVSGSDFRKDLTNAPTLHRGSVLISNRMVVQAAGVFYSPTRRQFDWATSGGELWEDQYYIGTDGIEFDQGSHYTGVTEAHYFKPSLETLNIVKRINVDIGELALFEINLSPGIYCLGKASTNSYWGKTSGCTIIRVE